MFINTELDLHVKTQKKLILLKSVFLADTANLFTVGHFYGSVRRRKQMALKFMGI